MHFCKENAMRLRCAIGGVICLLALTATAPAETLPFIGYVRADGVKVYSGPGTDFYATGELAAKTPVQVFAGAPGGWCAIRPPKGSFSWIPSQYVRTTQESGMAVMVADNVPAYVGSELQDELDVVQVRLQRGEPVQVIGAQQIVAGNGTTGQTWYKISPPAGEFRWVLNEFIDRERPEEFVDPKLPGQSDPSDDPGGRTGDDLVTRDTAPKRPARVRIETFPIGARESAPTVIERSSSERAAASTTNVDTQRRKKAGVWVARPPGTRRRHDVRGAVFTAAAERISPADRVVLASFISRSPAPAPDNPSGDTLQRIDLDLSMMAARETNRWQFEALRTRAEAIAATGRSPLERGQARLLLERIDEFEKLRQRQVASNTAVPEPPPAGSTSFSLADAGPGMLARLKDRLPFPIGTGVRPAPAAPAEPDYEGTGWLMPVVSHRGSASPPHAVTPPFALTDEDGQVLQFVTPIPGLNLRAYARQKVGVFGQRTTSPQLDKPHLTASRIVQLTRQRK